MIIPIRTDYRMRGTPWVNYALVAINVAVYFAGLNGSGAMEKIQWLLLQPETPRLHQFFSSAFLHADLWHLGGNMLFLWVFGNPVNDRFGHVGYLMFYLGGAVLAGIGYLLLSGAAPVLGASGAIAAVTGAYLVLLPRARVTVLLFILYIIPFELSSLYFLLIQIVWNLYLTLTPSPTPFASGGVAYAAHSAGYAYGIIVAAGLMAIHALPRDPFDLLNLIRTWRRRTHYRHIVKEGYDPFSFVRPDLRTPPSQWVSTRTVRSTTPNSAEAREFELRRDINDLLGRGDLSTAAGKYLELVQIADDAILPLQQQLDIANQLMAGENYPAAADAYERFLKHYQSTYEHVGDIHLMLGLLYGRYLHQYDRARQLLESAAEKLTDSRKLELARSDLQALRQKR